MSFCKSTRAVLVLVTIAFALVAAGSVRAEVSKVRISHGYLPLMVMASEKLIEKHAKAAGLGEVKATYLVLDAAMSSTMRCCRARSTSHRSACPAS